MTNIAFPSSRWVSKTFENCDLEVLSSDGLTAHVYIRHDGAVLDKVDVLVSYIVNNYYQVAPMANL